MKWIIIFFCIISTACNFKKPAVAEISHANTIPTVWLSFSDANTSWHQDTLYYQTKPFSGFGYSQYPNGDTASKESYWQGLQEGEISKWYPNHQLAEHRTYIAGKKEGIHQAWWPDGKQKFWFTISNDAYAGTFQEWNQNGVLVKCFHYQNGQEQGSQRLWWDDGSVRANYVIKNGKKYGLIGVKLCSNPYDSINKK